ncbi:biotin holocarboxylase synthetase [Coemansia guatemalensis]|uniref:Biotin holocarboxylase synthetase n=1 Tax=Coemansia guatemalensis TaxID=2761395 RepID=A0A9W8LS57_9FUNG|nr:biotin holocarboxylase synthetase [Coemansia guatemalensis]
MAGLNVLVYSGPGVGLNAHAYLVRTLRQFLSHRYAVITVGPETLRKEPWESKAAIIVFPGGRDMPYVAELNGEVNRRIKEWVKRGGKYLGFCAGGYYGSGRVVFEPGTPMEVIGDRELALFKGTCVGCAYPGYDYKSEDGARAVEAAVDRSAFNVPDAFWKGDPAEVRVYYNGGGYFLTDDFTGKQPEDKDVSVLVRYPTDVTDPYDRKKQVANAPAVISCKVGRGIAVLSGMHPEYAWDFLAPSSYTKPYNKNLVSLLRHHDAYRRRLIGAIFTHMKLVVDPDALVDNLEQQQATRSPSITPTFFVPARIADAAAISSTMDALKSVATTPGDANVAGIADVVLRDLAEDIHVVTAAPGNGQRRVSSDYQCAVLRPEQAPEVTSAYASTTVDGKDHSRKHSMLVLCTPDTIPDTSETPRFDMQLALKHMRDAKAHTVGSWLMYSDTTWSTQTFLEKNERLLSLLPNGTVNVATRQLTGRGRGRNTWISPLGCLQFTTLIRHPNLPQAPVVMMQYLMSLAIVEAVKSLPGYEGLPLRLKWPNDVYALHTSVGDSDESSDASGPAYVKIGGILVGSSFKNDEFTLLFGSGINVANRLPTTSINSLIREYNNAHGTGLLCITPEKALALFTAKFEEFYRQFLVKGFEPFLKLYYKNWLHTDQLVSLADRSYERAKVVGLSVSDGQLQVRSLSRPGTVYNLQPDGNSFDVLQGLISRKVL